MMAKIGQEGDTIAMFFSSSKIEAAWQQLQEEEHEKNAIEAEKKENKCQRQQVKKEKQLLIAQRKAAWEKACL